MIMVRRIVSGSLKDSPDCASAHDNLPFLGQYFTDSGYGEMVVVVNQVTYQLEALLINL
jgi:hypothetical protein